MGSEQSEIDMIGGFEFNDPWCRGCRQELLLENAWMTDGCPCNSVLGVNNQNEQRWRLLMQLQQQQSLKIGALESDMAWIRRKLGLPADAKMFTPPDSIAGQLHVWGSDRHGMETYIRAYKCDDKQGEIARLTLSAKALDFLKRASDGKHRIVPSGDLTTLQQAEAQACGLFYVEPGGGLGWALVPWDLSTPKDRERETAFHASQKAANTAANSAGKEPYLEHGG